MELQFDRVKQMSVYLNHTPDWYESNGTAPFAAYADYGENDYTTDTDTLMTYIYPDTQLQTVQTEDHKDISSGNHLEIQEHHLCRYAGRQ